MTVNSKIDFHKLSLGSFITSCTFIVFLAGYIIRDEEVFPYKYFVTAKEGFGHVSKQFSGELPPHYHYLDQSFPEVTAPNPYPGLNLVTKLATDDLIVADIMDAQGNTLHRWELDWFDIWPDADHLHPERAPKQRPGTTIHGAVVMDNGDLVFNYEYMGLVRVDLDGKVVWRLPYETHHSVHLHDDGNLWVSGMKFQTEKNEFIPHIIPPFWEDTILKVSPEGEILKEWNVPELLRKNGYAGLLHLRSIPSYETEVYNLDPTHLNDVETFPSDMKAGVFNPGDVLISLRNINAVMVFNEDTDEIKSMIIGEFINQHDPDFIDGNTISVFDNNQGDDLNAENFKSRILKFSFKDNIANTKEVFFEGSGKNPFYTQIQGKNQWLPNGNLLITDSLSGRGFELNQQGEMVWQYFNYLDDEKKLVGRVTEVQRLSEKYEKIFSKD